MQPFVIVGNSHSFVVRADPVPKPRMTAADKWKKRPCVVRYREYGDIVRKAYAQSGMLPLGARVYGLFVEAVFAMPKSWSKTKRTEMDGKRHQVRPDADNVLKAVADHLFDEDSIISDMSCTKRWGETGRVVVEVRYL